MSNFVDGIPHDGSVVEVVSVKALSATVILYTLTTVGVIFCIVCLIFNIVFSKRKYVGHNLYDFFVNDFIFLIIELSD